MVTGSTVNCFIEILKQSNVQFKGAVSSSEASTLLLQEFNVEIFSLNDVNEIQFYIDGADEVDPSHNLIKGGGGAHTREKLGCLGFESVYLYCRSIKAC